VQTSNTSVPGGSGFAPVPTAENTGVVAEAPRWTFPTSPPAPRTYTRDGKTYTSGNVFVPGPQSGGPSGGAGSGPVPVAEGRPGAKAESGKSGTWKWLLGAAVVAGGYYWWTKR
jgi:hypothetical protein